MRLHLFRPNRPDVGQRPPQIAVELRFQRGNAEPLPILALIHVVEGRGAVNNIARAFIQPPACSVYRPRAET